MKVLLDIRENKAAFVLELLNSLSFVKVKSITDEKAQLMNYDIITIPPFDKQLKRLAKKYFGSITNAVGI